MNTHIHILYIYIHNYKYNHILITHLFVTIYESSPLLYPSSLQAPVAPWSGDSVAVLRGLHHSHRRSGKAWLILNAGWWFGTFFIFPYIGNSNLNWLSYFSEGLKPPTRTWCSRKIAKVIHRNCSNCSIFFWRNLRYLSMKHGVPKQVKPRKYGNSAVKLWIDQLVIGRQMDVLNHWIFLGNTIFWHIQLSIVS
jgi:hypothetical protein